MVKDSNIIVLIHEDAILNFPLSLKSEYTKYSGRYAVSLLKKDHKLFPLRNDSIDSLHFPMRIEINKDFTNGCKIFCNIDGAEFQIHKEMFEATILTHVFYEKD